MSNTAKPRLFFAVEYQSTKGPKWLLAEVANQGAARGRAEKLGNFMSHIRQIPISEQQYREGKALLEAQGDGPQKLFSNHGRAATR
jgi:hypothetical protein